LEVPDTAATGRIPDQLEVCATVTHGWASAEPCERSQRLTEAP